jgi:hypothetical protein
VSYRTPSAIFVVWLTLAIGCQRPSLLPMTEPASADNVRLTRLSDAAERVSLDESPTVIAREKVVVSTTDRAVEYDLFGRRLNVWPNSQVLLGSGTDAIYAVTLAGRASSSGRLAEPGQVLMWTPRLQDPLRRTVYLERFLDSADLADRPELEAALSALAERQADELFWGRLRPTGLNALGAAPAEVTAERARYLQEPAVVRLRFAHATPEEMSEATVRLFLESLTDGDVATVAALLRPEFLAREGDLAETARRRFAERMAERDWSGLADAQVTPRRPPLVWDVLVPDGSLHRIELIPGDGAFYVVSLTAEP